MRTTSTRVAGAVLGVLVTVGGASTAAGSTPTGLAGRVSATGQAASASRAGDLGFRIQRLGGADRYEAAVSVSREFFSPGVATVVIASGEIFSDGVAAGPAAAELGGPVLFVKDDHLPSATRAELVRLRPGRIVVLGGPVTITDAILLELDALASGGATRVAGSDRYATAAAVSARAFPAGSDIAYVASGRVWPDALTGGPAAAVQNAPMLLTNTNVLPPATQAELIRLKPDRIMLLGGPASVTPVVADSLAAIAPVERVSGKDRYTTALAVSARVFGTDRPGAMVATGTNYPDALAGGAAAERTRGPILLVRAATLPSGTTTELRRLSPDTAYLLGGTASVPADIARMVQRVLGICWSGQPPTDGTAQVIQSGPSAGTLIAFTFDMGGRLEGAIDIVRYLRDHQVCTTFFPTSIMASTSEGREVLAAIAEHPELFEVGNHTVHHCDLAVGGGGSPTSAPCARPMTVEFIRSEITDAERVLRDLSGMPIRPYWRPPYGSYNSTVLSVAASAGYPKAMMWSRDTADWDPATTTQQIIDAVTSPTPPGGTIVLGHMGGYHTGAALPTIVDTLRSRGLTFTTVSDVLDR